MTCIIGLVDDGKVWMGSDSAMSDGWQVSKTSLGKVFIVQDKFLIGGCGSMRLLQVLQYHLQPRARYEDEEDDQYMVLGFVEAVRKAVTDCGALRKENNEDMLTVGGAALVGFNGKLYALYSDLQIDRYMMPFSAIGLGGHFAMGAMKAYENLPPEKRIRESLKIAAFFSEGVRPPFIVRRI